MKRYRVEYIIRTWLPQGVFVVGGGEGDGEGERTRRSGGYAPEVSRTLSNLVRNLGIQMSAGDGVRGMGLRRNPMTRKQQAAVLVASRNCKRKARRIAGSGTAAGLVPTVLDENIRYLQPMLNSMIS
ncbi:hypothetical protein QAD02_004108 [Eretmocerus hayati]|uniref:Uncharacterized protein n=1 Tax=Eretmocerus hayati TaxID=131215 RepID=A0ACC2NNU3_9HYME|nr:hypothetical protein QAD02_004108 [Eretmocerus hayati]